MNNSQKLVCAFLCFVFGNTWLFWGLGSRQFRPDMMLHWALFGLAFLAYALLAVFVASMFSSRFSRAAGRWLNSKGEV